MSTGKAAQELSKSAEEPIAKDEEMKASPSRFEDDLEDKRRGSMKVMRQNVEYANMVRFRNSVACGATGSECTALGFSDETLGRNVGVELT